MTPTATPSLDPVGELARRLADHEERVRRLEQESAKDRRLEAVEVRVRALEVSTARLWVICSGASFMASALASALVTLAARAIAGG